MANLREGIEQYVSKRHEFQELEEGIMRRIREAFDLEIPTLNEKLPAKYTIRRYDIRPPERFPSRIPGDSGHTRPSIVFPLYDSSETYEAVEGLNRLLTREYRQIEEELGVRVRGFLKINRIG